MRDKMRPTSLSSGTGVSLEKPEPAEIMPPNNIDPETNFITLYCGPPPLSHDWTVSVGGARFGLVEWRPYNGAECGIAFGWRGLTVPFGAVPVVAVFLALSAAVIIAALAFRARHRRMSANAASNLRAFRNQKLCILAVALTSLIGLTAQAQYSRMPPTNSLAFHLQSLGRTPTKEEHGIIEAALTLMQRHQLRTDYPLRSVRHDDKRKEWVLDFDSGVPDGAFLVFIRSKKSEWFEMQPTLLRSRIRFPAEKRRR
jgi:hypothetical protein